MPSSAYRPRSPADVVLYQIVRDHFETFRAQAGALREMETTNRGNAGKGRPKGALNHATRAVKEFAVSVIADPEYQASVRKRAIEGKLGAPEPVLYYYAAGKPREAVEHSGGGCPRSFGMYCGRTEARICAL